MVSYLIAHGFVLTKKEAALDRKELGRYLAQGEGLTTEFKRCGESRKGVGSFGRIRLQI